MIRSIRRDATRSPLPPEGSPDPRHLWRLKRWLFVYAAVVLLAGWAAAIAYVITDREQTIAAARHRLLGLGIALNAHTEAILADGVGAARAAANHFASLGGVRQISAPDAFALLRADLTGGEYVAALFVAASDRTLIANRGQYQHASGTAAPWLRRAFPQAPEFFVGVPMPHPAKPDQIVIPIARKIMGQGSSAVYAGAWFGVDALRRRYASILPDGGVMGLLAEDGSILAQIAAGRLIDASPLPDRQDAAFYREAISVADRRPTIIEKTPPGGVRMTYAVSRPEPAAPLIAVVGRNWQSIIAPWQSRTSAVLALAAMASAMLLVLTFVLNRYMNELSRAQSALERVNETLEQRVAERTLELREANEELEAFSAAASHDLRSPLTTISGQAGLLAMQLGDTAGREVSDRLERIQSGVRCAVDVIDGLLLLAHVSRQDLKREEISLSALVEQCIREIRERDPTREVDSRIEAGVVVAADPRLMKSLVSNLVSNAWKYSAGKQRIEIQFTCEYGPAGPAYCITDRGAGFDMAHVTHLFQPFRRLHSVQQFPGTGLGLATVARIVRRYGGTASARGEVGSGATFCFTLPLAQIARQAGGRCA